MEIFALYFSLCCSIFKDQTAVLFADSLDIIALTLFLVNTFFKLFQKNRSFFGIPFQKISLAQEASAFIISFFLGMSRAFCKKILFFTIIFAYFALTRPLFTQSAGRMAKHPPGTVGFTYNVAIRSGP